MPPEKWPWYGNKTNEHQKEYQFTMYRWGKLPNNVPAGVYVFARSEGNSYAGLYINVGTSVDDVAVRSVGDRGDEHIFSQLADRHCTHVGVHEPQGDDTAEDVLADIKTNDDYEWPVAPRRSFSETKWEG